MSGNTIGKLFTVTTFGESHGPAHGLHRGWLPAGPGADRGGPAARRGPPPHRHLALRQPAPGSATRCASSPACSKASTTGTPIGILIENTDARSRDYEKIKDRFRPGHADYTYQQKYGLRDYRGGGRSSARETVMRVAAGAIARKYLAERLGVRIYGYLSQIGALDARAGGIRTSPTRIRSSARTRRASPELEELIWKMREAGDSIGARVTVVATGVPPGLGEPVFDRLDADIAHAMMSINAVKAVEIGAGTRAAEQTRQRAS